MSLFKKIREGFEERAREMHKRGMAQIRADELLNELCEHLRKIGVNGTVHVSGSIEESMGTALTDNVLGYVKIEGRNIDSVQLESRSHGGPTHGSGMDSGIDFSVVFIVFYYHYVVRANVEGLDDKLWAEIKPIKKGLLSREVVDFRWGGGELAERLNSDIDLRNMLLREGLNQLPNIEARALALKHRSRASRKTLPSSRNRKAPSSFLRGSSLL